MKENENYLDRIFFFLNYTNYCVKIEQTDYVRITVIKLKVKTAVTTINGMNGGAWL
jgi:hypothetical protein